MGLFKSLKDGTQTDLKSLDYGGSKPLITKNINDPGNIVSGGPVDDLVRITKLLTKTPGIKFIANQAALEATQVKVNALNKKGEPRTAVGSLLSGLGQTALSTVKIIGSTLAQVPTAGTGLHFVRGFAGKSKSYLGERGDQVVLGGGNTINTGPGRVPSEFTNSTTVERAVTSPIGINTTLLSRQQNVTDPRTGTTVINTDPEDKTKYGEGKYKDLLEQIEKEKNKQPVPTILNYSSQAQRESKYKLGDPGKVRIGGIDTEQRPDGVNANPINDNNTIEKDFIKFFFEIITPPSTSPGGINPNKDENSGAELDTTAYGRLNNTGRPTIVQFRAFLDSLDDSFNADWTAHKYIGRGESFYTYGGFDRSFSVSFKIAAQSAREMQPLYEKIVTLASSTAPTYDGNFMKGTIVRATIGDYLSGVPGIINSVQYNWNSSYPWQIQADEVNGGDLQLEKQELPMVLDCNVQFTPIHDFIPQTGLYHFITSKEEGKRFFKDTTIINPSN